MVSKMKLELERFLDFFGSFVPIFRIAFKDYGTARMFSMRKNTSLVPFRR